MSGKTSFFFEDTPEITINKPSIKSWIHTICANHDRDLQQINYILCSDDYLLNVNKEYLNHDYYTDIITFDSSEEEDTIEGDIFVSLDRVKDNAKENNVTFDNELLRVLAHGILHLIGYGDKSDEESKLMRKKEDECLSLFPPK